MPTIPEHVSHAAKQLIRGDIGVREYLEKIEPEQRDIGDGRLLVAIGVAANRQLVLTPTQLRYVGLAAEGNTDSEIAEDQGVSSETVKYQLHLAYRRLGARNRAHAVAMSIRRGYDLEPHT